MTSAEPLASHPHPCFTDQDQGPRSAKRSALYRCPSSRRTTEAFEIGRSTEIDLFRDMAAILYSAGQNALPPDVRQALWSSGLALAPQTQSTPRERWMRLWQHSLAKPESLGFVRVHGTRGLGQLLVGNVSKDPSNVASRLLKRWERHGVAFGYWDTTTKPQATLTGVHLPHATEAAHWVAQRRAWAAAPRCAPRPPMRWDHALEVACAALEATSYPPPIYTRAEADEYLARDLCHRRLELVAAPHVLERSCLGRLAACGPHA